MRMKLYKVEINRPDRLVTGYIVAQDEEHASEILSEHIVALNQEDAGFTLVRIDETLSDDLQLGLNALLEHAPVGFASFCKGLGWLAHTAPVPRLRLYRIDVVEGDRHFVIAPNQDMAVTVFCTVAPLPEDRTHQFGVHDALVGLSKKMLRNLPALLEVGPVGMVEWHDDHGWSIKAG